MKKLAVVILIMFGAFQIKAANLNNNNNEKSTGISIINTIHSANQSLNVIVTASHPISTIKDHENPSSNNRENQNTLIPSVNINQGFANRYTSLFWYAGREVFA